MTEHEQVTVCTICQRKNIGCKTMENRQFDHGMIGEQVPLQSHIYGGQWYELAVKQYGEPPEAMITLAKKAAERALNEMNLKLCINSASNMNRVKRKNTSGTVSGVASKAASVIPATTISEDKQVEKVQLIDFLEDEDIAEVDEVVYETAEAWQCKEASCDSI